MNHYVYLAGPFFNSAQLDRIESVEKILDKNGVAYFSPRKSDASLLAKEKGMNPDLAKRIFDLNISKMQQATLAICVPDFVFPGNKHLEIVGGGIPITISLPDSGTVWEMGYLYAQAVPIVVVQTEAKMNLMLSRSAWAVCYGWCSLTSFIESLAGWKGKEQ